MLPIKKMIAGYRAESKYAALFCVAVWAPIGVVCILNLLRGAATTDPNSVSSAIGIMGLGFIALAYSRLVDRLANIAEAIVNANQEGVRKETA